jgi:hypothetical protein
MSCLYTIFPLNRQQLFLFADSFRNRSLARLSMAARRLRNRRSHGAKFETILSPLRGHSSQP